VDWGDSGYCKFPIFTGAVSLPLSMFYVCLISVFLLKNSDFSWIGAFISLIVCAVMTVLLLVCGILVTAGLNKWCSLFSEPAAEMHSCEDAAYIPFLKSEENINTTGFFVAFGAAKFGVWTSWICWIILLACSSVKLYQYHQQEDFFISMNRERERLLQRISNQNEAV